jgi:HlyD family secretion protein
MNTVVGKLVLPLVAVLMLVFGVFHILKAQHTLPKPPPPALPARSPFGDTIAGSGVVEARSENIAVGAALPGVVLEVFVPVDDVGKQVNAGEPLFRVDDRQLRAQLTVQQANLAAARSQLAKLEQMPRREEIPAARARVQAAEANALRLLDQFQRAEKLASTRSIGIEERNVLQRQYEEALQQREQAAADLKLLMAGAWEPDKAIARAAILQAEAQIAQTETEIERTLVRAPVAGHVLQVNVRPGEYVGSTPGQALVVLGDLGALRVRVDIDEADIPRVRPGMTATAYPRGESRQEVPLTFVRVEPMVTAKRSLTGDNTERVDTRVLKVIYEVAGADHPLYVGQQLDVFLAAKALDGNVPAGKAELQASVAHDQRSR